MTQDHDESANENVSGWLDVPRAVTLPDGAQVPAIGQGTWRMGDDPARAPEERAALVAGLRAGARLIDTAEMYGSGASERLVGAALTDASAAGIDRKDVFLVSKVLPEHASRTGVVAACEHSLERLGTDYLDLYLLHWRVPIPLSQTIDGMRDLVARGLIRRWGVSNFDADDLRELWEVPGGRACATNQVLYHLGSRGIEFNLLPWMRAHGMPAMAYCPLAQQGRLRAGLLDSPVVAGIARAHDATPAQVLLAFAVRGGDVVAIPQTSSAPHARENAAAMGIKLAPLELKALDDAFPAPHSWTPLDMV